MIYLVDIDGTVADLSHRRHFIEQKPKDWDGFFKAAADDKPIFEVITVIRALHKAGNTIINVSGRSEDIRDITEAWLTKYRVPHCALYMRKSNDQREDNIVKSEILDQIIKDYPGKEIGGVFDDRNQVVDMFRARGLKVFQVAPGDF